MVPIVIIVPHIFIFSPCFVGTNQSNARKANKNASGKIPGYIINAAPSSPCIRCAIERCIPQPGQSMFVSCLLMHGSIQLLSPVVKNILIANTYFFGSAVVTSVGNFNQVNAAAVGSGVKGVIVLCSSLLVYYNTTS